MKLNKKTIAALLAFCGGGGGGITPSGTLSITSNGTYDVGAFAEASVLVHASAVVSGTKQISANGTHDVTAFASAEVLVPASAVVSGTLSITSNGVADVTNYANVDVQVSGGGGDTSREDGFIMRTISGAYENSRVTSIAYYAFACCTALTTASFPACTIISSSAFYSCTALTTVSFPMCTKIGSLAFFSCPALTAASFPECTSIFSSAFQSCTALTTASFPKCSKIGSYAFSNCKSLMSFYLLGSSRCGLGAGAFTTTPMANSTYTGSFGSIFVPASLYTSYITAQYWSAFSERIVSLTSEQIAALG